MIVVENNVVDDDEVNWYLRENDETNNLTHDEEKFGKMELMMIDLLKQMYIDEGVVENEDQHAIYEHQETVLYKTMDFHLLNDQKNVKQYLVSREMMASKIQKNIFFS